MLRNIFHTLTALLLITLFAAPEAKAQRHYVPHVHVGGHAGVTLSQQSFYPSVKETMLQGITMGFSFRYAEERHVGLVAELNLTQRGWKENFEEHPLEYQHRLTYIELPVHKSWSAGRLYDFRRHQSQLQLYRGGHAPLVSQKPPLRAALTENQKPV